MTRQPEGRWTGIAPVAVLGALALLLPFLLAIPLDQPRPRLATQSAPTATAGDGSPPQAGEPADLPDLSDPLRATLPAPPQRYRPRQPIATDGWNTNGPATPQPPPPPPTPAPAPPVRVHAPTIDLDAPLIPVGLEPDGSMQVPDFGTAGWYQPGPPPGAPGPAVLAGHVDSWQGPDVFFHLAHLRPGDPVHIDLDDGRSLTFTITHVETHPKDALPTDRIWADSDQPLLRLITCGGDFDRTRRTYRSNVIAYAEAN